LVPIFQGIDFLRFFAYVLLPKKSFWNQKSNTFLCKKNQTCLTPGIIEKKVPPRHQSRYIGSTLDVVHRKLKVVEAPITVAIGS
jgi:hypothetical protein